MSARPSVVVVGGGISGLAAAWELSGGTQGPSDATPRIEVIDVADRVGGTLRTATFDDLVVDQGADGFLARRPEAVTFVRDLGWDDQLEAIDASGAWIYLRGHLDAIPTTLVLGVPTTATSLSTLRGLGRRAQWSLWRDRHLPRPCVVGDDATIGDIIRAKLGDEVALQLVEPMIGGIQAGRIDDLSAAAVFPALLTAARAGGSLQKALSASGPVPPGPASARSDGPTFFTLRHGVGSLPGEVERQLRARGVIFTLATPVTALRRSPTSFYEWEVDTATTTTPANSVVVATPPKITGRLLGQHDPALAAIGTIDAASAAMVTFAVPANEVHLPAEGTGVLVPLGTPYGDDTLMITALTFLDRKWPHLRRDGRILVRVHVGRSDDQRAQTMDDDALVARVRAELNVLLGRWPHAGKTMVVRWHDGLPQYRPGHLERVERAREAASSLGLFLAGNAYDGVGVPASIGSGRRAGRDALAALSS